MASIRRRSSRGRGWSSTCALAITSLFVGQMTACNEIFGIDAPTHAVPEAGAAGSGATGVGGTAGAASGGKGGKASGGAGGASGGAGGASGGKGGTSGEGGVPDTGGTGGDTGGIGGGTAGAGDAAGVGGAVAGTGGDAGMGASAGTGGVSGTGGDAGSAGSAGSGGAPVGLCEGSAFRGGELVLIAGGTLMIGTQAGDLPNTQPVHAVTFADFCIDRTEVTMAAYRDCVDQVGCEAPDTVVFTGCNWDVVARDDHPVTCVDHARAAAFCAWAGKRLPTEKEWEYAARGSEGRLYPWGDADPDSTLLNFGNNVNETTSVGFYADGETPVTHLADMAGNVWEWTASEWTEDYDPTTAPVPGNYIARGGSYASAMNDYVRSSWRDPDSAGDQRFGFRCAYGGDP